MAKSPIPATSRKPRRDAQQNRERILETAKEAFTRHGGEASLDEIARQAGVGTGTLYRHFPTRDTLIEAVYRRQVEKLAAAEGALAARMAPLEALRAWMLLLVDSIAEKQIIAPALNSIAGGPSRLYESSRSLIQGAMEALVKGAKESGDLRPEVEASDLLRVMVGVSHVGSGPEWRESAKRLVEILIAGSRRTTQVRFISSPDR